MGQPTVDICLGKSFLSQRDQDGWPTHLSVVLRQVLADPFSLAGSSWPPAFWWFGTWVSLTSCFVLIACVPPHHLLIVSWCQGLGNFTRNQTHCWPFTEVSVEATRVDLLSQNCHTRSSRGPIENGSGVLWAFLLTRCVLRSSCLAKYILLPEQEWPGLPLVYSQVVLMSTACDREAGSNPSLSHRLTLQSFRRHISELLALMIGALYAFMSLQAIWITTITIYIT